MNKKYYTKLLLAFMGVEVVFNGLVWGLFASQADKAAVELSFKEYLRLKDPALFFTLDAVMIAPLLETLLFQLLMFVLFVRKRTWRYAYFLYYAVGGTLFSLAHLSTYIPSVAVFISIPTTGLLLCWVFAFTYDKTRRLPEAYLTTVLIHALSNLYTTLFYYLTGDFKLNAFW